MPKQPPHFSISTYASDLGVSRETIKRALDAANVLPTGRAHGFPTYRLRYALDAFERAKLIRIDPALRLGTSNLLMKAARRHVRALRAVPLPAGAAREAIEQLARELERALP